MPAADIVIVTPALAAANNGNWQTAWRWQRMLSQAWRVRITDRWSGGDEKLMIALHARRSADSVAAWRAAHPARPLLLVLTGTDLYRDIAVDASARASLDSADRLVVLNERGERMLPPELHGRARVVLQSAPARRGGPRPQRHLRLLMVGHLRDEKSPRTYFEAVRRLAHRADLCFDHIGAPLDPALGDEARALAADCPHYRWLGALPHGRTRAAIARASALVHASVMEGGAHVVIEALRSGTPVLASAIAGNLGLLGDDHPGCFPVGDAAALATLIERVADDRGMIAALQAHGERRAPLFAPEAERAALHAVVAELLPPTRGAPSP